jgi:soluble lytic murein transglycosylase
MSRMLQGILIVALLILTNFNFGNVKALSENRSYEQRLDTQQTKITELEKEIKQLRLIMDISDALEQYYSGISPIERKKIAKTILAVSEEYSLQPELILAVIKTESSFKPYVISDKGACGLMQLLPSTAEEVAEELRITLEKEHIFDPIINIILGSYYLNKLTNQFGDFELALTAYNMGPGRVMNLEEANYPYSREYAETVLKNYNQIMQECF